MEIGGPSAPYGGITDLIVCIGMKSFQISSSLFSFR